MFAASSLCCRAGMMVIGVALVWFGFCSCLAQTDAPSLLRSSPSRHMRSQDGCKKKQAASPTVVQHCRLTRRMSRLVLKVPIFPSGTLARVGTVTMPSLRVQAMGWRSALGLHFYGPLLAEVRVGHDRPGFLLLQLTACLSDAVGLRTCFPGFPRSANQHLGPCSHRGPGRLRPRRQASSKALLEYSPYIVVT